MWKNAYLCVKYDLILARLYNVKAYKKITKDSNMFFNRTDNVYYHGQYWCWEWCFDYKYTL